MMKLNVLLSLMLLVVTFLLFTLLNNLMFSGVRFDMTENKLYSLSGGTREILSEIDEPINLYFFFSAGASEDLTSLRAYAARVQELLEEYQLAAGGKLRLEVIDPEPFSEAEDLAAEYGLQSVPVNQAGDSLYFGLAGTNALDGEEVIGFFQPEREALLEYELTKLVYNLSANRKPSVGIYSGLEIDQGVNSTTYQQTPAWAFLNEIRELYDVRMIESLDEESIAEVDLLVLIHPKDLSESNLFTVDQHVMGGNRLLVFLDPMAEMDDAPPPGGMNIQGASDSHLNELTAGWGIRLREKEILADAEAALLVSGADGVPVRHLGILGFGINHLSREDIVTSPLESVNFSTAGIFDVDTVSGIQADPLVLSSTQSAALPVLQFQFMADPSELQKGFKPTGERYVSAVRLSGSAESAFPDGFEGKQDALGSTDALNVVLVADTDVLSNRLWVEVQNFFGQQIASAFADNGSFVSNLVENLSGSRALIDVRSRGQFSRPFVVVEALRRRAEASYLSSAEDLQARLAETEQRLSELESARIEDGLLTLTPEQEAALEEFQDEKLRIRKELREVRHQLDSDIRQLGSALKFLNILLLPLILTGMLVVMRVLRLHRIKGTSA